VADSTLYQCINVTNPSRYLSDRVSLVKPSPLRFRALQYHNKDGTKIEYAFSFNALQCDLSQNWFPNVNLTVKTALIPDFGSLKEVRYTYQLNTVYLNSCKERIGM